MAGERDDMERRGERRLTRSRDRLVAGVAGGFADYFGIDYTLVRVLFVVVFVLGAGWMLPVYLVLWLIMPEAGEPASERRRGGLAVVLGATLIVFGVLLLTLMMGVGWVVAMPGPMFSMMALMMLSWPLLLIVAGILVIVLLRGRER